MRVRFGEALDSAAESRPPIATLDAYRSAAGSGHPEVAAFASFQLGLKLLDLGQFGPARGR